MYIVYPCIGDPLSLGAFQSTTTFDELIVVVGAAGASGICAANSCFSFE